MNILEKLVAVIVGGLLILCALGAVALTAIIAVAGLIIGVLANVVIALCDSLIWLYNTVFKKHARYISSYWFLQ